MKRAKTREKIRIDNIETLYASIQNLINRADINWWRKFTDAAIRAVYWYTAAEDKIPTKSTDDATRR